MSTVAFPGLGLELHLDPIALRVFGWPIHWYGVIIALGFILAVAYCSRQAPRFGIRQDDILDMLLAAVPLCIIGARLYYIIFYLDLYRRPDGSLDFGAMVRIWDGGLAIYGGVIMAVIVLLVFCKVRHIKFLAFGDLGSITSYSFDIRTGRLHDAIVFFLCFLSAAVLDLPPEFLGLSDNLLFLRTGFGQHLAVAGLKFGHLLPCVFRFLQCRRYLFLPLPDHAIDDGESPFLQQQEQNQEYQTCPEQHAHTRHHQFHNISFSLGDPVLHDYGQQTYYDSKQSHPFHKGSRQNHAGTNVPAGFRLASNGIHCALTDGTYAYASADSSQTGANGTANLS